MKLCHDMYATNMILLCWDMAKGVSTRSLYVVAYTYYNRPHVRTKEFINTLIAVMS